MEHLANLASLGTAIRNKPLKLIIQAIARISESVKPLLLRTGPVTRSTGRSWKLLSNVASQSHCRPAESRGGRLVRSLVIRVHSTD